EKIKSPAIMTYVNENLGIIIEGGGSEKLAALMEKLPKEGEEFKALNNEVIIRSMQEKLLPPQSILSALEYTVEFTNYLQGHPELDKRGRHYFMSEFKGIMNSFYNAI